MDLHGILFLLIFFVTNTIMMVTGFAGTMMAMPASILLLGADEARFILNVTAILSCGSIAIQQWKYANKKEWRRIIIIMLSGMVVGTALYHIIPLTFLLPVYGVIIIAVALKQLFLPETRQLPTWLCFMILAAAGIIHGMFLSGGALLVLYATMVLHDKSEFRATIAATWAVLEPVFFVLNFRPALWTATNLLLIVCAIPPLVLSVYLGNYLHKRIGRERFMQLTYALLILSGLSIIL